MRATHTHTQRAGVTKHAHTHTNPMTFCKSISMRQSKFHMIKAGRTVRNNECHYEPFK